MSKVKCQLLFKNFFIGSLVRNVLLYTLGIGIFAHRIGIEAACPQISSPKKFFDFFMLCKYFSRRYAFDYRHDFRHTHRWNALHNAVAILQSENEKSLYTDFQRRAQRSFPAAHAGKSGKGIEWAALDHGSRSRTEESDADNAVQQKSELRPVRSGEMAK